MPDHPGVFVFWILCFCGALIFGLWKYEKAHPCLRYERRLVESTYFMDLGNGLQMPVAETNWENVCVERAP